MKQMIINALHLDELRMGIIDNKHRLVDCYHAIDDQDSNKGNIYTAIITSVESSLNAVFVDYGGNRQGFLPFKEISPFYLKNKPTDASDPSNEGSESNISAYTESLRPGQKLLVQVEKDERGTKGAAMTTYLSLAGSYLVLMPFSPGGGGISRQLDSEERDKLRGILSELSPPQGTSLIVRTAGINKEKEDLEWDLAALSAHWAAVQQASEQQQGPCLIHCDSSGLIKLVRDYLRPDVGAIVVDQPQAHEEIKQYLEQTRPNLVEQLTYHESKVPIFTHYQIENQVEGVYEREVILPSGGTIVIDSTEALTSIDINSAKATRGSDIEETALQTNLEAADEIARQLRLRDIGGLVVIDFIDMTAKSARDSVEQRLSQALNQDRARTQLCNISKLGLLEMSRQRLRSSVRDNHLVNCPRCQGRGHIRSVESMASSIVRAIEQNSIYEQTPIIQVQLPIDVATFLTNEYRQRLIDLEGTHQVKIVLIPNPHYELPRYQLKRVRGELSQPMEKGSYELIQDHEQDLPAPASRSHQAKPLVKGVHHYQPERQEPKKSLIQRLWMSLLGGETDTKPEPTPQRSSRSRRGGGGQGRRRGSSSNRNPNPSSNSASGESRRQNSGNGQGRRRRRGGQRHQPSASSSSEN